MPRFGSGCAWNDQRCEPCSDQLALSLDLLPELRVAARAILQDQGQDMLPGGVLRDRPPSCLAVCQEGFRRPSPTPAPFSCHPLCWVVPALHQPPELFPTSQCDAPGPQTPGVPGRYPAWRPKERLATRSGIRHKSRARASADGFGRHLEGRGTIREQVFQPSTAHRPRHAIRHRRRPGRLSQVEPRYRRLEAQIAAQDAAERRGCQPELEPYSIADGGMGSADERARRTRVTRGRL